jgi:hypothetical protein
MPSQNEHHSMTMTNMRSLRPTPPPITDEQRLLPAPIFASALEVIDSVELAKRLSVPESWIRSRTNKRRTTDPIPHYRLGRYIRFSWGSAELRDWLQRQLVSTDGVWSKR